MVIRFRIFENTEIDRKFDLFYYIPYNDLNLIMLCIDKIDTDKKLKEEIKRGLKLNSDIRFMKGIFIGILDKPNQHLNSWPGQPNSFQYGLVNYQNKDSLKSKFKELGYIYGGEIELEDFVIIANKYNM